MHFSPSRIFSRVDRFKRDRVNANIHKSINCDIEVLKYEVDSEPVPASEIIGKKLDDFTPFVIGSPYGKVWGTTWFFVKGKISRQDAKRIKNIEFLFDLGWFPHSPGLHTEAFAYTLRGKAFKALHPQNGWLRLKGGGAPSGKDSVLNADGSFSFYIEAASNPLLLGEIAFQPTEYGDKIVDAPEERFILQRAEALDFNNELFEYSMDLEVLVSLARELPEKGPRAAKIAFALENSMNAFDERDLKTLKKARSILKGVLERKAAQSECEFNAVGHAHIDSAWLWPVRETKRKVARTLSNVFTLLKIYPKWIYTMSSAQQFVWLEENYPDLFEELKYWVSKGRIIPIGGQWVEADGVLPSGESLVRQITYGKKYFENAFGIDIKTIWLPDSFGYTGAYPQIARRAGFDYFLTQKISWGDSTKFPHNSFFWQGIDGSRIVTHFPPTDTYNGQMASAELHYGSENYKENAISKNQIYLYGNGDGGGGPTREMIAKASRFEDLEGAPRVRHADPNKFYKKLEKELLDAREWAPVWQGELYLEFHRGTLTSQHRIKKGNRETESLLRTAESSAALKALSDKKYKYPKEEIDRIWKTLLLNQFHDILPGTTISWVVRETVKELTDACKDLRKISNEAFSKSKTPASKNVKVKKLAKGYKIENDFCQLLIDKNGNISSYILKTSLGEKELIGKNQKFGVLQIMHDKPIQWDTWDIDKSAFHTISNIDKPKSAKASNAGLEFEYKTEKSKFFVRISLFDSSTGPEFEMDFDWAEDEKLLKFAFPFDLRANITKAETQYGLIERPVFNNLLADDAKFETSMHRFVFIEDNDFQIGVVNNCLYGFDSKPLKEGGTLLRPTLLKSSKYPDPNADMMKHSGFRISIVAGERKENVTLDRILQKANELNSEYEFDYSSLFEIENIQGKLVLDWIKLADENNVNKKDAKKSSEKPNDFVVRLYEPFGGSSFAKVHLSKLLENYKVKEVNLLETDKLPSDISKSLKSYDGKTAELSSSPFQLTTLYFEKQ
ncbi:MAG: glycosyl hydrolase-related protein [Bifidobacteriaceae bacterium]|jgi:alpha-mannosidase|nr:glycosyl hydrolase-related protein [Bifidobacteriaceae bacterium]